MKSSYRPDDVRLLLKDITGMVKPQPTKEREKLIQSGRHYCEMLPIEYVPSQAYLEVYHDALDKFAKPTAYAVGRLAEKVKEQRGKDTVLVSLARAGIPIGILLKHYILQRYGIDMPHYALSIIRGRGIDRNAMQYLLKQYAPGQLLFVDGWIGKGAILKELQKEIAYYRGVSADIAVLADPAKVTELCGTHEDILVPSACLNCTVSGLISRTFLRSDIIGETDFHGAVYYGELEAKDLSYEFIHAIEAEFSMENPAEDTGVQGSGVKEVEAIARQFGIDDINLVKPGIGEATRVLLRRVPWKILIAAQHRDDPALAHIIKLAREKDVPVETYPLNCYKACGIIQKMPDT